VLVCQKSKIENQMATIPVVLTIAGSDNSAGAGAQADLKTISALGGYGVSAITCVVAEVPGKVSVIQPMTNEIVAEQIRLLFQSFPIGALKTGMLYSRELIETVCANLEECFSHMEGPKPALVVDPVMVATSGDPLLQADAVALYRERLFPKAALITPNLDEVSALLGKRVSDLNGMREAGLRLAGEIGCAVLVKGGHLRQARAIDLLVEGSEIIEYSAPYVPGVYTHGTGCTYSAAIATGLAQGLILKDAVSQAKALVSRSIEAFLEWTVNGRNVHALHHFAGIPPASERLAQGASELARLR
jgi:hydroxymethylpyrimidine/phosphomethylpyrimidine kinase